MKVKLKKINNSARLPVKGKEGDFCHDVWAVSEEEIAPNVWRYGLGFKYEIERPKLFTPSEKSLLGYTDNILDEYEISIGFKPRSSIYETGMSLVNSQGCLDEFYRGEAAAIFYHVLPKMERYHVGDKIGQIYLEIAPKVEFEFVDEINENTERGNGGFGSTGKQ